MPFFSACNKAALRAGCAAWINGDFSSPSLQCFYMSSIFSLIAMILMCPVMSWKYRRAKLVCYFVSPRVGLRKWGWCGRNRHQPPMYCFKAQEWCQVRRAVPVTAAVHLRSMRFCTFVVKKKCPPGINFQGRIQSWYQESWLYSSLPAIST